MDKCQASVPSSSQPSFLGVHAGDWVSLTSMAEIRYEGTVCQSSKGEVALRDVRCYGTEGRQEAARKVLADPLTYQHIVFNGWCWDSVVAGAAGIDVPTSVFFFDLPVVVCMLHMHVSPCASMNTSARAPCTCQYHPTTLLSAGARICRRAHQGRWPGPHPDRTPAADSATGQRHPQGEWHTGTWLQVRCICASSSSSLRHSATDCDTRVRAATHSGIWAEQCIVCQIERGTSSMQTGCV